MIGVHARRIWSRDWWSHAPINVSPPLIHHNSRCIRLSFRVRIYVCFERQPWHSTVKTWLRRVGSAAKINRFHAGFEQTFASFFAGDGATARLTTSSNQTNDIIKSWEHFPRLTAVNLTTCLARRVGGETVRRSGLIVTKFRALRCHYIIINTVSPGNHFTSPYYLQMLIRVSGKSEETIACNIWRMINYHVWHMLNLYSTKWILVYILETNSIWIHCSSKEK